MREVLASVLISIILWNVPAFAVKPRPPIQLHLTAVPSDRDHMKLTLHATAFMDVSEAELFVDLPASMALVTGDTRWRGPMTAGENKTLSLDVITSGTDTVRAEGTVTLPQGGSFTQHATLSFQEAPDPNALSSSSIRRKQGEGTILEFSGE